MAYATPADVAVRWGRELSPEESALIGVRLADVERMILRRVPDLAAKIAAGTVLEDDVVQVEADAVLRLVRNPDGYVSETDGDYTYMLAQDSAPGRLSILPEEWELLGVTASGMFIIAPRFEMPT